MYRKEYYLKNKKKFIVAAKKWFLKNKDKILIYQKEYRLKNKNKAILESKKYYLKNKKYLVEYRRKYYKKNSKVINKKGTIYTIKKYHSDIKFKILFNLRTRIRNALNGLNKSNNTLNLLGVPNIEFLKQYLENKFKPGMSWEKRGLIHIDHIIPCASFDLKDPKQQAKCFHYTNLQPLWAYENLSKGAKILKPYK